MIDPAQLSTEQVYTLQSWANDGLDLNAIQKKLHDELGIKLTFMDTRFLLQDLDIHIKTPEPEPSAAQPDVTSASVPEPAPISSGTQVTLDEVTPPHAIIAGKVAFKSGAKGEWSLDRTGRLNWAPTQGEPTAEDMQEFEVELQKILRSQMGAI